MAKQNDHDLLRDIKKDVKNILGQLTKLNERTVENEDDIGKLKTKREVSDLRIKMLEKRPSATKAVFAVGGLLGIMLTVFKLVGF